MPRVQECSCGALTGLEHRDSHYFEIIFLFVSQGKVGSRRFYLRRNLPPHRNNKRREEKSKKPLGGEKETPMLSGNHKKKRSDDLTPSCWGRWEVGVPPPPSFSAQVLHEYRATVFRPAGQRWRNVLLISHPAHWSDSQLDNVRRLMTILACRINCQPPRKIVTGKNKKEVKRL